MERAFHRDNLRNITQRIVRVATQTAIFADDSIAFIGCGRGIGLH